MNLKNWLDQLAAALQHKPTPLEAFEYLQELKTWNLTDEEWLEVKAITKRRHQFFPRLVELQEIVADIRRNRSASKPSSAPVFETWTGDDGKWYARRLPR